MPATVTQTDCEGVTPLTKPCFKQTYHHKYLSHEKNFSQDVNDEMQNTHF